MTHAVTDLLARVRRGGGHTHFPEREFRERLRDYAAALTREIVKLDEESNWAGETFVPLEAEVDVRAPGRRPRHRGDLLRAIRGDRRSRIFLVLGDPGAGKSVALRRLCRELLARAPTTQTLPLYVNLREWTRERPWTPDAPPTPADLHAFVLNNLRSRADVPGAAFLDDFFEPMLDRGMLFLVLDSFDEIPEVLDAGEDSWLVDALSNAIDGFLLGAHRSRGVVASRPYHAPTSRLGAAAVLEIQPLTERKIARLMDRALSGLDGGRTVRRLFRERPQLVPIARNPLTASLILAYLRTHDGALPHDQAELYASHITRRVRAVEERFRGRGISPEEVLEAARDLAAYMFTMEQLGLDAPVDQLSAEFPGRRIEEVVEVLALARLGRLGPGFPRRFGFVHRRFAEYFVVQWILQNPSRASVEAIPRDSRFRDALALYCQVAAPDDAERFAFHAGLQAELGRLWEPAVETDEYRAGVNGLRFLSDAFHGRPECVEPHRSALGELLLAILRSPASSLVSRKLAVEAAGLLDETRMRECLLAALALSNPWIDETVFRVCQGLEREDARMDYALCQALDRIFGIELLHRLRELRFALSLTDAFPRARLFCLLRWISVAMLVPGLPVIVAATLGGPRFGIAEAVACALIAPWYKLLLVPGLRIPPVRRPSLRDAGLAAASLLLVWLAWPLLWWWTDTTTSHKEILLGIVLPLMTLGYGWMRWMDGRTLARLAPPLADGDDPPRISRAQVAGTWAALHTSYGRTAYVKWLRRHRFQAHGDWPERQMPDDDTLLAELEAEWLGVQP
jgi:hypothetical protein